MTGIVPFRFLGRLSDVAVRVGVNISMGNAVGACVDAACDLLNMTSSIITCFEEFKRTRILADQVYKSKIMLDMLVEQERNSAQHEVEAYRTFIAAGLKKLKLELKKEYEYMCRETEVQKRKAEQDAEYYRAVSEKIKRIRLMVKDSITVSEAALRALSVNYIKNRLEIESLQEQIRIAALQYNKLLKLSF